MKVCWGGQLLLALGVIALAGAATAAIEEPARTAPALIYRLVVPPIETPVDRTTPALDTLFANPAGERSGRRSAQPVAGMTLALESARTRRRPGPMAAPGDSDGGTFGRARARTSSLAAAAEWTAGGEWRLSTGVERVRIADVAMPRGKAGGHVTVAALDYRSPNGWSVGGGLRSVGGGGRADTRLLALAAGAPRRADGGFVRAALPLEGATLRLDASSSRLDAQDAALTGGAGTDHRATLTVQRDFH